VLAKANRITSADDYRFIVRRGAKVAGAHTVSYLRSRESGTDARFGFIVSKKVGTAVRRNLVRRRLKAACRELVDDGAIAVDVVVRALPTAASADYPALRADVASALAARGRRSRGSSRAESAVSGFPAVRTAAAPATPAAEDG
jgi:ribonuclease P protein component